VRHGGRLPAWDEVGAVRRHHDGWTALGRTKGGERPIDGALSIVVGLVLALLGARSIRLLFFASGFGLGWLLAAAFSASAVVSLLVGVAGGVLAFVLGLIAARVAFFAMGALVGAVIGASVRGTQGRRVSGTSHLGLRCVAPQLASVSCA
jgi:hypothetical protein